VGRARDVPEGAADPLPPWAAGLGACLILVPVLAYFQLVWAGSVEIPLLDDYDAIVGFLKYYLAEDSWSGRLRVLFAPHNEHLYGVPHALVLLTYAVSGHLELRVLNLLGNGLTLLLLGALFAAFQPGQPPAARLLGFAPAALFVLQPQAWTLLLSPTVSLSNAGVVAFAAASLLALGRDGRLAPWLAGASATAATFSQGNGFLVLPLGVLLLLLRGRARRALAWSGFALALLVVYFAVLHPPSQPTSPLLSLGRPDRLIRYALNFAGCAGGFSQRGASLLVGAALVASFGALCWRGLPRANPLLFGLFLFLLGSIAANALVRAHQGAGAPLLQPRYAFYSAVLLALTHLGWMERLRGRRTRRAWLGGALAASLVFSLACFSIGRAAVLDNSERLTRGLDLWWTRGAGGLLHPDSRKAEVYLLTALDRGWLRLSRGWIERHAAQPLVRDAPPPGRAVVQRLQALHLYDDALVVSGWAYAGASASDQQVELALRSASGVWFFPALEVRRPQLAGGGQPAARQLAAAGFRAVIPTRSLPPGRYQLGVLVRQGGVEHLTYRRRPIEIPATAR